MCLAQITVNLLRCLSYGNENDSETVISFDTMVLIFQSTNPYSFPVYKERLYTRVSQKVKGPLKKKSTFIVNIQKRN
jgi:hypothetical protein